MVKLTEKPQVSIVLPTYNGERYIEESIDSVISQSFTDWELIIVDDCSSDKTPSIVDGFAKRNNRIKKTVPAIFRRMSHKERCAKDSSRGI